jgi:nitrous oxidase accessory protein NosD
MQRILVRAGIVSCLAWIALSAFAAEGRTPVFAGGTFISADGKYIVTRNIAAGAGAVITIGSPNVDLDLNGFTLSGGGAPVISVVGPSDHVTIKNGVLSGGTVGIDAGGAIRKLDIEDVKIHNPTAGAGIHLADVEGAAIRRVEITDTPGEGISWDGPGTIKHGVIEGSLLRRTSAGIVVFNGSSLTIQGNHLQDPGTGAGGAFPGYGIVLPSGQGVLVAENTIERSKVDGIQILNGKGNKLFDNVIRAAGGNGIHLDAGTSDTLILNNVATGCGTGALGSGGSGLMIEGTQNVAERNILNSNAGIGLHYCGPAACGNTLGRNTARGNTGAVFPGFCGGCAAFGGGAFGPNSCNQAACGAPNSSYGDNLIPGPPIF